MTLLSSPVGADLAARILGPDMGHVPVLLQRLASARVLWLNERAMRDDPAFANCGSDPQHYARHLIDACAFQVAPRDGTADAVGQADRYGGERIGFNGGSGRAVVVNGYHVKGVGRTPLVSALTSEGHASGGAYLEECVRETIFAEIVGAEFPFSAVPTLAIIDTDLVQDWHTHLEPQSERRTLLVRPAFVRPAHFQRAAGFQSGYEKEGSLDARRVREVFGAAVDVLGADGLVERIDQFWDRWTAQVAYAFVHRLPHGSDNTSNVALDGRLVDFGAMSAVPTWSAAATAIQPEHFVQRFGAVARAVRSMAYFFGRHFKQEFATQTAVKARSARSLDIYRQTIATEVLRVCGVSRQAAREAVAADVGLQLWNTSATLIGHYQREMLDMVEGSPEPRIAWDVDRVWEASPPTHLCAMRQVLDNIVPAGSRDDAVRRNTTLAGTRPLLFKRDLRTSIYRAVDVDRSLGPDADAIRVATLIGRIVGESRRDLRD